MTAPLVVGPPQGYRCWRVDSDGGEPVLRSLYHATAWPVHDPLRAACATVRQRLAAWVRHVLARSRVRHVAPTWGCQCGTYACTQFDRAAAIETALQPGQVVGVVALWGHMIRHAQGYRAEYARPVKLFVSPAQVRDRESRSVLEAIAQRYAIALVSDADELTRR